MPETVAITQESLRRAMRDPRYWQQGHPERAGYVGWITEGWQALSGNRDAGGPVQVRAYTRTRNGRTEHVAAHTRSDPPGGNPRHASGLGRPPPRVQQVQAQLVAPLVLNAPRVARGALRLAPLASRLIQRGFVTLPRPSLLELAERQSRRGTLGGQRWYNAIPEQEGERPDEAEDRSAEASSAPEETGSTAADGGEARPRYTVHDGAQGKHVPGHNNHQPGTSELLPGTDAQRLVDRYAHRGQSANGQPAGQAGARERFDTGDEIIGIYRHPETGRSAPATRGLIHYGGDGRVHIVPSRPRGWIN